jgi:peptidoglycan/LPS O-acetylase OafA/YrhL
VCDDSAVPAPARLPHVRALDGVRGIAVAAVLLFHANALEGGYLGVDLFFVLSGFLITSLLIAEAEATSGVRLVPFWARRARRLLPALFLVIAFVGLYAALVAQPSELHRIRDDAWATLAYVANWRFVFGGFDYFALFSSPSPLNHTWSLAIEEQFYLVWPLVFAGVLAWGRKRDRQPVARMVTARRMLVVSLTLAFVSIAISLGLWFRSHDATRIYYGTDTRAASILLGAALGALLAWRGPARGRRGRVAVEVAAIAGAGVLALAWYRLSGDNLYRGGLLLCALAGVAVIASAAHPRPGPVARVLATPPLVGLGVISYGVYLWHWPIYLWLDANRVGLTGWPLFAVRLAVTLPVAIASFVFVERPIRRGAFSSSTLRWLTPVAAAALIGITVISTAGYEPAVSAARAGITVPARAAQVARQHPGARRLMVVGNSVAYFLAGEGFSDLHSNPTLVTLNDGAVSCVFPRVEQVRYSDSGRSFPAEPCGGSWPDAIRRFRPQVVLMTFGDSGTGQFRHGGRWVKPCDPGYRDWYVPALDQAVRTLSSRGARVVLTTSAYSQLYVEAPGARNQTDCTNALTREFAGTHPGLGLVDLGGYVCPSHGQCRATIDGTTLRADGVHYEGRAARLIAQWILPQLGFVT